MKKIPFSYHTFMFPFTFDDLEYISYIVEYTDWIDITKKCLEYESAKDQYNMQQYFNHSARNVITRANLWNENQMCNSVVKTFRYPFKSENDELTLPYYQIFCDEMKTVYELEISRVTLDLYNTNVGILTFELINEKYNRMEDIQKINDLGRRISIPSVQFPEKEKTGTSIVADQIQIVLKSKKNVTKKKKIEHNISCANFSSVIKGLEKGNKIVGNNNSELYGYSEIVSYFLIGTEQNVKVRFNRAEKQNNMIILAPVMDDRMFVHSVIINKMWSDNIKEIFSSSKEDGKGENNVKNCYQMNAILSLDKEGSTCQNEKMLMEFMEKNCYTRWSNYGTLFGITQHSFVTITDIGKESSDFYESNYFTVILPTLTMYKEMVRLTLAQRASIIQLSNDASDIVNQLVDDKKRNIIEKIKMLHEKYVMFQNQMLLYEVTTQQQGIELYQMLQKELFIIEQKDELENQLKNFYEIANMYANDSLNKTVMALTYVSIGLTLVGLFWDFSSCGDCWWVYFFVYCVRAGCLMGIFKVVSVLLKKNKYRLY